MRKQFNQDFVGEDRKPNVETFHETSLHSTIVSQTPEEFDGVDLEKNQNVYVHQIVVDEEPQVAMLSIPEIEAVVVDAQFDGEKIEEIQDTDFSHHLEKLRRNLTPQPPSLLGKGENSKPMSLQERGFPEPVKSQIQDIGQSILEELNFILPWRLEIAATHKTCLQGYFNEAHLGRFIEYFLLRSKVWTNSGGWVKLANINNKIDSS
ncbi:hypothetical protein [Nostoc sphaeroides]|uniref:hypothetical protein n=1 Tax=Nostoc sphaeroides TaxID=446679 RepID=UPI000E525484|nr:hypothetical protein [Nostoc sphaeroides]